ncbi:MAG: hypothetical protein HC769_36050 [Cyanobacteria bacterium CRU_2_1]|nr:hypothetical protein [Cyanobacteria bacterium CRU_2_1]
MVWIADSKSKLTIKPMVEQIIVTGQMSRNQHLQLTSAMLSDPKITYEDRRQINRIFDYIQTGRIRLVD